MKPKPRSRSTWRGGRTKTQPQYSRFWIRCAGSSATRQVRILLRCNQVLTDAGPEDPVREAEAKLGRIQVRARRHRATKISLRARQAEMLGGRRCRSLLK